MILEIITTIYVKECFACVPIWSFTVSKLTFRSLSHFEFIFLYRVRECFNFIDVYVAAQLSKYHLLKTLSFPHCIFLPPSSQIN